MKILLYGGTFDPPHCGHLNNLCAAAAAVKPDWVIVMPAGVPPHKAASRTPAALRYEMCGCFRQLSGTGDIPWLTVSDWEMRRAEKGCRNYTVETLEMLRELYPSSELYLAIGSDMLLTFTEWHRWRDILHLATLVCESREQGDAAALHSAAKGLEAARARVLFADAPALPLASSELRTRMAAGEDCTALLPEKARCVIAREGLYRTAAPAEKG